MILLISKETSFLCFICSRMIIDNNLSFEQKRNPEQETRVTLSPYSEKWCSRTFECSCIWIRKGLSFKNKKNSHSILQEFLLQEYRVGLFKESTESMNLLLRLDSHSLRQWKMIRHSKGEIFLQGDLFFPFLSVKKLIALDFCSFITNDTFETTFQARQTQEDSPRKWGGNWWVKESRIASRKREKNKQTADSQEDCIKGNIPWVSESNVSCLTGRGFKDSRLSVWKAKVLSKQRRSSFCSLNHWWKREKSNEGKEDERNKEID